jgi:hypothetical protein
MEFKITKVATCGCEIKNEKNETIAWSIDKIWGEIIAQALEMYLEKEDK